MSRYPRRGHSPTEPTSVQTRQSMKRWRIPKRVLSQPTIGIMTVWAMAKAVSTSLHRIEIGPHLHHHSGQGGT